MVYHIIRQPGEVFLLDADPCYEMTNICKLEGLQGQGSLAFLKKVLKNDGSQT